ncbi:MAG: DNA pilot protein [Arizlama microvirus]|nr:MAG: DNA pilot protein [Arizlama microvirus]
MPIPFLPILQTVAPLFGNFIQNRMNKKMSDYTYSKDLAMWEKTNQYNAPAMQMRRYGEAGLNPNLVYSQGNSGNATASMPKYTPPERKFQMPDTMAILSQFQDFALKTQALNNSKLLNETNEKKLQILGIEEALKNLELNTKDPLAFRAAGWGNIFPDGKSSTEYSLDAQRLKNAQTEQQINQVLKQIGLTSSQADWAKLKYERMLQADVNIDKDAVWQRILADFFGETVNKYKNKFKNYIK